MQQPKVSILIPVYNTAKYLPTSLRSAMTQTLRDIEIIAVNDASPDNAASVLAEFAALDDRIKIVTHEKNGGILAARISGIRAASGEYVMVLDADDTLDRDIARAAYEKAKATGADIVHFRFDVRLEDGKKKPFTRNVEKNLDPYRGGPLLDNRVFEGAFRERLYRWNICGKLIARSVFSAAADALPPGYYIMAEDFCFYSLMSYFAKHYECLWQRGYNYVLDVGVSAYISADRKSFERSCSVFTALNAVRTFLTSKGVFEKYEDAFRLQERLLLGDLLDRWYHRLIPSDRAYTFRYMLEHYDGNVLIAAMAQTFAALGEMEDCAAGIGLPEKWMPHKQFKPEKIAIYLDKIQNSDTALQLFSLAKQNPSVSFTIVTTDPENITGIPTLKFNAKPLADASPEERAARVVEWNNIIREHAFDTVIYAEPPRGNLLWDVLALKNENICLLVIPASSCLSPVNGRCGEYTGRITAFRFADAIGCFSPAETDFFRTIGKRASLLQTVPRKIDLTEQRSSIVWTGNAGNRLELSLIAAAFAKALPQLPQDMELVICSPAVPPESERKLRELEANLGLQKRSRIIPDIDELSKQLRNARLAVGETSETETSAKLRFYEFTPVITATLNQDELADKIVDAIHGNPVPEQTAEESGNTFQTLSEFVNSMQNNPPLRSLNTDFWEKNISGMYESSANYERFAIEPPREGDTFFTFYRFFDQKLSGWFPGGTKKRHTLFAGIRYIMRKLFRKG